MDEHPSEQLKATLNLIPVHVWYAKPAGGLMFVNKRSADYRGLANDHPLRLGTDFEAPWDAHLSVLHPDDHDEARKNWSGLLKTGQAGEVTFRVRNANGEYRWFLSRAEPFRAADGTLLGWIGISVDIEERKQAEFYVAEATGALRRSETELRQMLDLAPQITGVLGPRRERIYANRVALTYYGVTLDEWCQ